MASPLSMKVYMPMTLKIIVFSVMLVLTLDTTSPMHDSRHALSKFSAAFEGLPALILPSSWRCLVVT